ncbi:MAG: hypothetical protein OEU09_21620 [Rhodospirillales bacterium]|nr:hypothetical protein [Rhodospirillales bacterium]MDH3913888.1 hypothetical protein [Rhodospirillales bacterium]MDH3917427.1 hypothetical protein [Rhodospirillales bacterium]MDH3969495.1 hypothetical protein [Rhodospirillales bacterium]
MGAGIRAASHRLAFALLFAASGALAQADDPGSPNGGAAQGSFRAAQERGLDLSIGREALDSHDADGEAPDSQNAEDESPAPAGSYRAAQDVPAGKNWSRRLGKNWVADPVAMNRRQDGTLDEPNADVPDQVLGIEVRRPF